MRNKMLAAMLILAVVAAASGPVCAQALVSSAFSYQGQLKLLDQPLNDTADFEFTLWNAEAGGSTIGSMRPANNVTVTDGLFTAELSFGVAVFNGENRWLEIAVRNPAGAGAFTTLTPRQPLTAVPYALQTRGLFVDDNGNVGIGTETPVHALYVESDRGMVAVYGSNTDTRSISIGVAGLSNASLGRGVYGQATAASGSTIGGTFLCESTSGTGVYASANAASGTNYGVYARTNSPDGYAGYFKGGMNYFEGNVGIGTTTPGQALHVVSDGAIGVKGENTAASGSTSGGTFLCESTSGTGVYASANAASGTNYGVYARTNSPDGYAGYFEGGMNYFEGRVFIGAAPQPGQPDIPLTIRAAEKHMVFAENTATSGWTYGGVFRNYSTEGQAVVGQVLAQSGVNYGVVGVCKAPSAYGVYSSGDFGATGSKSFIQPHPSDPSKEIRFVCLEGNESGTYFRGSTHLENGRAYIDVPEEFRLVSELDGLTVQVTAMGPDAGLWVESKGLDRIVVVGNGNVEFDYFVNGVRRGFADMELIRENHGYVPEIRGVPYGTQYRPAHRQILVENGILNPDFTPNETTAATMGWTLREPTPDDVMPTTLTRK